MSREKLVESYRNARMYLKNNNVEESIKWLEIYSNHLPSEISHEPQYWLVEQYLKISDDDKAFDASITYLEGCTYPHASMKAKLFSDLFRENNYLNHSFSLIRISNKYLKLQEKIRNKAK